MRINVEIRLAAVAAGILMAVGCGTVDHDSGEGGVKPMTFRPDAFIVKDGVSNAEVVISPDPKRPRMVNLAALEFRYYIEKMSGARLPIVSKPNDEHPVKIYVGESEYAKKLGVTAEDLKFGAYRMVSGDDWLALLGRDEDFTPPEPWNRHHGDLERAKKEWDEMVEKETGSAWGYPFSLQYKSYRHRRGFHEFIVERYGEDALPVWNPNGTKWTGRYQGSGDGQGFWSEDKSGSLNAVYAFLRALGIRWYMPEEIGEVVPERKTIPLPNVNVTERPDFDLRSWCWYNYSAFPFEHVMWARRLGINSGHETLGHVGHAHGLSKVHAHDKMKKEHPEYYALCRGKRETEYRGIGHCCFSSQEFFDQTVRYLRFLFDHYDVPHASIWPMDGFHQCACPSCRGVPPSEQVWGFVDRVARELYKTHPDRLISCGAYTPYIHPPKSVENFTPNVAVFIANCRRPVMDDPKRWNDYWKRVAGWRAKVAPGNILRVENNRYGLNRTFPIIHPRMMAKDLKALKGICRGECDEESQAKGRWHSPGFDHLSLYVNGRLLWDADLDVEALIEEYYERFYGPATDEMKKALEFAQAKYSRAGVNNRGRANPHDVPLTDRVKFGELLEVARAKAGDTVYGQRIQTIIDELPPLDALRKELAEKRAKGDPRDTTPRVTARRVNDPMTPDVQSFTSRVGWKWKKAVSQMATAFNVGWEDDALVFDVTCKEPDMKNLNVAGDVWDGDSVTIVLESPCHSFYEIEINPDGEVHDADRVGGGRVVSRWRSMVDVKTEQGEDFWRVIARIPIAIVDEDGAKGDPMNYVVGPRPGDGGEWFFNVARKRKRPEAEDRQLRNVTSVFSKSEPYYLRKYLDPDYFAKLDIQPQQQRK